MIFFKKKPYLLSLALVSVFSQGFLQHNTVREDVHLPKISTKQNAKKLNDGWHMCRLPSSERPGSSESQASFVGSDHCSHCGRRKGGSNIVRATKSLRPKVRRRFGGRLLRRQGDNQIGEDRNNRGTILKLLDTSSPPLKKSNEIEYPFLKFSILTDQKNIFSSPSAKSLPKRSPPIARIGPRRSVRLFSNVMDQTDGPPTIANVWEGDEDFFQEDGARTGMRRPVSVDGNAYFDSEESFDESDLESESHALVSDDGFVVGDEVEELSPELSQQGISRSIQANTDETAVLPSELTSLERERESQTQMRPTHVLEEFRDDQPIFTSPNPISPRSPGSLILPRGPVTRASTPQFVSDRARRHSENIDGLTPSGLERIQFADLNRECSASPDAEVRTAFAFLGDDEDTSDDEVSVSGSLYGSTSDGSHLQQGETNWVTQLTPGQSTSDESVLRAAQSQFTVYSGLSADDSTLILSGTALDDSRELSSALSHSVSLGSVSSESARRVSRSPRSALTRGGETFLRTASSSDLVDQSLQKGWPDLISEQSLPSGGNLGLNHVGRPLRASEVSLLRMLIPSEERLVWCESSLNDPLVTRPRDDSGLGYSQGALLPNAHEFVPEIEEEGLETPSQIIPQRGRSLSFSSDVDEGGIDLEYDDEFASDHEEGPELEYDDLGCCIASDCTIPESFEDEWRSILDIAEQGMPDGRIMLLEENIDQESLLSAERGFASHNNDSDVPSCSGTAQDSGACAPLEGVLESSLEPVFPVSESPYLEVQKYRARLGNPRKNKRVRPQNGLSPSMHNDLEEAALPTTSSSSPRRTTRQIGGVRSATPQKNSRSDYGSVNARRRGSLQDERDQRARGLLNRGAMRGQSALSARDRHLKQAQERLASKTGHRHAEAAERRRQNEARGRAVFQRGDQAAQDEAARRRQAYLEEKRQRAQRSQRGQGHLPGHEVNEHCRPASARPSRHFLEEEVA